MNGKGPTRPGGSPESGRPPSFILFRESRTSFLFVNSGLVASQTRDSKVRTGVWST